MEVSDRFPMLGFAVKVDEPNVEAEVVLANDVALFSPENKTRRTAANFYSSREHGTLMVPRGDGVFVVAPEVLARFIGSEKLHFGLATGRSGNGGLKVDALPREGSPYVSLRGFTGRTLRRSFGSSRLSAPPRFEWTGDAAKPGSEGAAPTRNGNGNGHANGAANGSAAVAAPAPGGDVGYDDGFGPLPEIPARESAYRGNGHARSRGQVGYVLSGGTTARQALDWIVAKVEQVVDAVGSGVNPPVLYRLEGNSAAFISAWENVLGLTGLISSVNAFLAELPALARTADVTLSIGPALDTPLFGGGVGVVFAPDGQVALFGTGDISLSAEGLMDFVKSLKLALQAKMKLGYNNRGLDGFANLAKVASINVGAEIVGGSEIWLHSDGTGLGGAVSIGVGFALQLAAQQGQQTQRRVPATGLVFSEEDMQRARTLARHHADLFQWIPPQSIVDQMAARGFGIQRIADAVGDINLDHYQIRIDRFPDGWDGPRLLQHFIRNVNSFVDTGKTSFAPYGPSDVATLASANPIGTVFNLDIAGPDNAAVVISAAEAQYYAVTTIRTPDTGDHPVSGHRQFGYFIEGATTTFYTRGADRSTLPIPGFEWLIWTGAEGLWQSFQTKVAAWVNDNGGSATILAPFSERFNPTAMRLTWGHFDTAQGLSAADPAAATPAIVPPPLPTDPRQRANRIGGQFGPKIGEALDLGLVPKALDALLDTLDPPLVARPMSYRRPIAHAQAASRSVNWDDVQLIGQPTNLSCWAAAGAMVVGWRDQVSLSPDTIANICGRVITTGISPYDHEAFGNEIGLVGEPPQSYSIDGFYDLLTHSGPLWVGKIMGGGMGGAGHAVVVTGMYTDGGQTYVRIADPWDRVIGSPGTPGDYGARTGTGSRYIMTYEDFQNEYELRIVGDPPVKQVLHSGGVNGRVPNTGTNAAPAGYAMSAPTWSINWDGVDSIAQPTALGCWATTLAMLIGWRDQMSMSPDGIAQQCGRDIRHALPWAQRAAVAQTLGLGTVSPQCYLPEGFAALIENHGPLYVGKIMSDQVNAGHAVLVVGMYTDGANYFVRIVDPMDRPVGTPGSPGAYASPPTHATGSRYIMRYEDFQHEYEMAAAGNPAYVQILHGGVPFGRLINRATTPPSGFAMAQSRTQGNSHLRRVPATALVGPVAIAIGEVVAGLVVSNTGTDISYQVDEYKGFKRPPGVDPQAPLVEFGESTVNIDWDDGGILSAIGLKLRINWQHDGWSLGNVVITPWGFNDAVGDALFVRAQISETARPFHGVDPTQVQRYANNPGTMLKITITYRRERLVRDDVMEGKEIHLLPTGQYTESAISF
jgi:hypothetical protein